MRKFLSEPLLHFLLIGSLIFLVYDRQRSPASMPGSPVTGAARIVIAKAEIDRMMDQFTKTWQRAPSEAERKEIIEDLVRSEIYYREAVAIGLDKDDEVLKRRLRQKMEFIFEDITSWGEPTDAELVSYMKKKQEKYLVDPKLAFWQVYVSPYRRGKNTDADARQILAQLAEGGDPDSLGDATMIEPQFRLTPLWEIRRQFGDDFADGIVNAKTGRWTGPVKSGFGLHLVLIRERNGGRLPELKEVREAVKRDWAVERQQEVKNAAYARLRERYDVVVEQPAVAPAKVQARR